MPGEWIDEIGALSMYYADNPRAAMDLYSTPINKQETMELARALFRSATPAYPTEDMGMEEVAISGIGQDAPDMMPEGPPEEMMEAPDGLL